MSLISHGTLAWGETEQACADRWIGLYAVARALQLAQIFRKTVRGPMSAYYRTVEKLIGEFEAPSPVKGRLDRLRESHARLSRKPARSGR